jgi:hypothetical protein
VRDEYETKRADFEEQISKLLGTAWKVNINPNAIWVYAEERSYGRDSLGACLASYVPYLITSLFLFLYKHI